MKRSWLLMLAVLLAAVGCTSSELENGAKPGTESAEHGPVEQESVEPTAEEQLAAAVAECNAAQAEFEARVAEASLYDRLGGREGIHQIFVEMTGIISNDPDAAPLLDGVDIPRMIEVSTDHLASQTGGSETYSGRDITDVHRPMNIDAAMFLHAGAAFGMAMENTGVPADVAQEVQCLMIGLRDEVMAPSEIG